ncbi:MAG: E3 binding domain-containing protein [Anaerolineales bacterium]|nr:E3 binding domain-containing protein [Anaerolineales bacterium]
MATPVIMPKFGMAQEDGPILRWLKQPGDVVERGDILLEVQTDKVDMEVESPAGGILGDVRFGPDETVRVTTVIATVFAPGEAQPEMAQPSPRPQSAAAPPNTAIESPRLTPVAQRMAADQQVDLSNVVGTGPAGRITKADVQLALAIAEPATDSLASGRVRATAARRLAREGELALDGIWHRPAWAHPGGGHYCSTCHSGDDRGSSRNCRGSGDGWRRSAIAAGDAEDDCGAADAELAVDPAYLLVRVDRHECGRAVARGCRRMWRRRGCG